MSQPPRYETRRAGDFEAELRARAQVWLPEWQPGRTQGDVLGALLKITARLQSEVAQRLDRLPEKNFRGLLHWLGVRGAAGRAARVPVVFQMTADAAPVMAAPPVQIQATSVATPVMFETTSPLELTPAALVSLIATDAAEDAYFEPPPGLFSLEAPPSRPDQWWPLSDAPAGTRTLQLDPLVGLDEGTLLQSASEQPRQYRVVGTREGLVEIEPAIASVEQDDGSVTFDSATLSTSTPLVRVAHFAPFDDIARNRQEHAIYLGAKSALDIEAAACIGIPGWEGLDDGYEWSFWGTTPTASEPGWQRLE